MTEASEVPLGLEVTKGVIAKFLLAAIGFVGTILFARILGPAAFGGFYLIWAIVKIAKLPIDGFSHASKKRFSESNQNRGKIAGATLLVILCVIVLSGTAAIMAQHQLASYSGLENGSFLLVILLVSVGFFTPYQEMLTATGRISLTVWIDLLRSTLTTPLQLLLVVLNYGAAGMAYGLSLATVLTIPVTHYVLRTPLSFPDRETYRKLWSYARHSTVSAVFGQAFSRFDILLLGWLLTPNAAGQYEVALKLTLPAVLLAEVASEGLMARISNLHSKKRDITADLNNTLSFTSILSAPIFFGGLVLADPLVVTIYGSEYAAAAPLLVGLALFRLVRTQSSPLTQAINGIDRPDLNVRISAVTLALNIVVGVALTLEFGSIGVVIATVAAETLRYSLLFIIVQRYISGTSLISSALLEQLGAAVLMGVVVYAVHQFVPVRSWLHLSALIALGALVYGVTLLSVSKKLRQTVEAVLADAGISI